MAVVALLARPASGQEDDGLLPPGDWTADQEQQMLDLIHRTEEALPAGFADRATAEAQGFRDSGTVAPGGYYHYFNKGWLDDDHVLDPTHPESLVYQVTWDEETGEEHEQLVAAMFMLPSGHDMSNIPEELRWWPGWHVHPDLCFDDDWQFTGFANPDGTCSSGHPLTGPPMLHIWIVDTECGHRFGGVDVGGLECDVHGGHDGHGGPTTTQPGHGGHDGHGGPTTTHPPGHGPTTTHPAGHSGGHTPTPARPIPRQPNFTG